MTPFDGNSHLSHTLLTQTNAMIEVEYNLFSDFHKAVILKISTKKVIWNKKNHVECIAKIIFSDSNDYLIQTRVNLKYIYDVQVML